MCTQVIDKKQWENSYFVLLQATFVYFIQQQTNIGLLSLRYCLGLGTLGPHFSILHAPLSSVLSASIYYVTTPLPWSWCHVFEPILFARITEFVASLALMCVHSQCPDSIDASWAGPMQSARHSVPAWWTARSTHGASRSRLGIHFHARLDVVCMVVVILVSCSITCHTQIQSLLLNGRTHYSCTVIPLLPELVVI